MKYYIIPVNDVAMEIYAENPKSALEGFAWEMDSDMNAYFKAVDEKEYHKIIESKTFEGYKRTILNFMKDIAMDDFGIPETDAESVAEIGWDNYTDEQGSEYECIELACEQYLEDIEEDGENEN